MTTFGVDFQLHLQDSSTEEENIPHIITSCIDEIDQRGKQARTVEDYLIYRPLRTSVIVNLHEMAFSFAPTVTQFACTIVYMFNLSRNVITRG